MIRVDISAITTGHCTERSEYYIVLDTPVPFLKFTYVSICPFDNISSVCFQSVDERSRGEFTYPEIEDIFDQLYIVEDCYDQIPRRV